MILPKDTRYCTQTIEPPYTERYVRWCERTGSQIMTTLLLDWIALTYEETIFLLLFSPKSFEKF